MALRFTNTIYVGKAVPSSSGGGGQSYSAGDGISINGSTISAHTDGTTIGFDSNGALSCSIPAPSYSAGNGIVISGGMVAAKVDSSTIGFDSNGALSCSVSGSAIAYVGSNGIDVSGTVISAKLDGSTISTNAAGELHCLVSGGGQTYSAGAGIVISDGGISVASNALESVTQVISSGTVARGGSDGSGGYFYVTQSGATMGVSGGYRISCGDTVNIRTTDNAVINLSGQAARIYANNRLSISCAATATQIQAGGASNTYLLVSSGNYVYIKHSTDTSRQIAVHMGMSATSNSAGIVQPDNSTCEVESGGIMSVKLPETLWTSGNAGSEITYPALDGANVIRAYRNGLLMESGADYVIGSSGVVIYTTPLESSDKVAFEYYAATPTRNIVPNGGQKSSLPDDKEADDDGHDDKEER